ncbi:MAG: hypothetical protein V4760_12110 [Bdellovibrionota bacterium]
MQASDEQSVARLFNEKPMVVGPIRLRYDRGPRFQSLLRAQGSKYLTVVGSEKGDIVFTASVSSTRRYVDGKEIGVSYLGDLRVKSSTRASRWWRKAYPDFLELIETSEELGRPDRHLTAVLRENLAAIQALSRSRHSFGVRYEAIRDVHMVNVIGGLAKRGGTESRMMRPEEFPEILSFIEERARSRNFGYKFPEELYRRATEWPGLDRMKFLLTEDGRGLRSVCLPWSPTSLKKMVVDEAPWAARTGFSLLKLFGRTPPRVGEPLETVYLTHAYWRDDVDPMAEMRSFVRSLTKGGIYRRSHMISFCAHEAAWAKSPELRGLLKQVTPVSLFEVLKEGRPSSPPSTALLDFEMGLV